jgi:N-acetylglucosaminyldiphosphoundecaprenol N-acetyl-beta-D-mannosaminyltransferase
LLDVQRTAWICGLPIDLLTMNEALDRLREAAEHGRSLVFATPNLNFLRTANSDPEFCEQILNTDLSFADGMPLLWLANLLGTPLRERVAGSDLMERLKERSPTATAPIRVFFFGGDTGVADRASARLNALGGGMAAAGALCPGFGSIEQMSGPEVADAINRSGANFLVVSLGASKGHAWIERNRPFLRPMVISHLGAVVNFLAGEVRRAPEIMRRTGLEWLWRMIQEPRLLSRYAGDAVFFVRLVSVAITQRAWRGLSPRRAESIRIVTAGEGAAGRWIALEGSLTAATIQQAYAGLAGDGTPRIAEIVLDGLTDIDSRGLGFLYALCHRGAFRPRLTLTPANARLRRLFALHRAECLLDEVPSPTLQFSPADERST